MCAPQELHSELKKVQAELSKYGHVNKKALDQFSNFTEQQQDLKLRRDEVEKSCEHQTAKGAGRAASKCTYLPAG